MARRSIRSRCPMPSPLSPPAVHRADHVDDDVRSRGVTKFFGGQLEVFVDGLRGDLARRGRVEPLALFVATMWAKPRGSNL